MSRRLARTATSTKDVSQSRLRDELDILLTTSGKAESTQDKTKELLYQSKFINFQLLLQHKYYASDNTYFPE